MKKQTIKLCLLFITTLILSCSDDDNLEPTVIETELPPITQTGENTFGCLINGNVFVPKDKTGFTTPGGGTPKGIEVTTGSFLPTYEFFSIDAENYKGTYIYIYTKRNTKRNRLYY